MGKELIEYIPEDQWTKEDMEFVAEYRLPVLIDGVRCYIRQERNEVCFGYRYPDNCPYNGNYYHDNKECVQCIIRDSYGE